MEGVHRVLFKQKITSVHRWN